MLIGLSGYAQAGKDTAGAMLVDGYGFHRVAFADPMRTMALRLDPIIDWYVSSPSAGRPVRLSEIVEAVGWERAKKVPEVRRTLQRLGTEAGRDMFGQDFWVDYSFRDWTDSTDWVITDVRFKNEAVAIVARHGIVVRVHRHGVTAPNDHVSEHDLDGWEFDYELHNHGSLPELESHVNHLIGWVTTRA